MSRRELFGSLCAVVVLVDLARVVSAPLVQPVAADLGVAPAALGVVAFIGVAGFLWNGLFDLYGAYLGVAKWVDEATGRLLLSSTFAAGVPAFLVAGRLADRFPNVPLILAIVDGLVICVLGLTLAEALLAVAAVSLLLGYVVHSLFPLVDTYVLSSLPDRHRGSAYALYAASMTVVQALGSGFVGTVVERGASYAAVFQALSVAVGAVVAVLFVLHRAGRLPAGGRPGETPAAGDATG